MRNINMAMIGEGFMGRTHSNAWSQVSKFFKPRGSCRSCTPRAAAREEHPKVFSNHWGWTHSSIKLAEHGPARRDRPGRHRHSQQHARPGGQGRHRGGQARLVREADRRHAGRGPRDGRGRQERPGQDVRLVQLPPLPGRRPGAQDGEGRCDRHDPARACASTCRTGPTSRFRWSGGSRRKGPAPAPTAT